MSQQVCNGNCGNKFSIPEDINNDKFYATGICHECYAAWAADTSMCFGKALASESRAECKKCSEAPVCLEWDKKLKEKMKEMATKTAKATADPAPQQEPAVKKGKGKAKATPAAEPTAPAPKATKPAPAPKAAKVATGNPYRSGSGLAIAFDFLAAGFRSPEEVVAHVGGKWKNPEFLKGTSLLKPGPEKGWTTEEKNGKYKIVLKK